MGPPPFLLVATPCYGGLMTTAYASSLLALQEACIARGIHFAYLFESGDALITRSRANLVRRFLETEVATHLLFIDADIGFSPAQVFRLLEFDVDVVAAAYPLKGLDWAKLGRAVAAGAALGQPPALNYVGILEDPPHAASRGGFARARFVGNGFLMIQRAALVRLCEAHPELRYRNLHSGNAGPAESPYAYALFDTLIDPETRAYLPEDFAFCHRWRALGGALWLDMESALTHVGTLHFVGNLAAKLTPSPGSTPDG